MPEIARYEFLVAEPMSATALAAFPELDRSAQPGRTSLYGAMRDDGELQGIIGRFFMMGFTVLEVHRLPD
jgi:hypothetical protein